MGHTVVGVFRYSGDADLAAAHLCDAYTLDEDWLDLMDEGYDVLTAWADPLGDADPVMKRWGDMLTRGRTVLIVRSDDPDEAEEMAGELHRAGAERVDLLPH